MKKDKFIEENKICKDSNSKREIGLLECFGMCVLGIVDYYLVDIFTDILNLSKTFVNLTSMLFFGFTVLSSIGVAKILWKGIKEGYLDYE